MKINTKFFGEVEIADDKIITFDKGIIGFPELKHFTMLHDEEKGSNVGIWSTLSMIRKWMTNCSLV